MSRNKSKKYSVEEIYQSALLGDEKAWEVIQLWISYIVRELRLNLRGEEAEDLVQMILLSLLEKIEKGKLELRSPSSFFKFLFKFSRDRVIDYSRKKEYLSRIKSSFTINSDSEANSYKVKTQVRDHSPTQDLLMESEMKWGFFIECVSELDEDSKRLFFLKIQQEASMLSLEGEEELNSRNNVSVKFFRLKKGVKKCLDNKLMAEGK